MLIRKPKCASVFTYREWLLNSFLRLDNGQLNDDLISNELQITLNAADQYSRNYYAWSHRTWLLTVYIVHNNDHHHLTNVINVCYDFCFIITIFVILILFEYRE